MTKSKTHIAIYAITENGVNLAAKLAENLRNSQMFFPARFKSDIQAVWFEKGEFSSVLQNNWNQFEAHIFIMATGIVVRKISSLLKDKTLDPAVVVCDEKGNYAISLLSGHIGGANRLTQQVAEVLGGQAVITTATDVQGLMAFDELAAIQGWEVQNPENIKILNSLLLENKPIAVMLPKEIYEKYYAKRDSIALIEKEEELNSANFAGAVILGTIPQPATLPMLLLSLK